MPNGATLEEKLRRWHLRLAVGYALVGVAYILTSDPLVRILVPNPEHILYFEMIKGSAYVIVTALLLHAVLGVIRGQVVGMYEARNRVLNENRALLRDLERRVQERTGDLEFVIQELESFTYSVSHDLRRPLRAIDARRSELSAQGLDPDARKTVEELGLQIRQMNEIIDDLLSLSRVGRETLRREPVDLTELSKRIVADLARHEPERRVDVEIQSELRAYGDGSMLNLALINLLHNAWKYTSERAGARIAVRREGESLIVEDNGIGFDPEQVESIFKPFSRLPGSEGFAGTGIGLAIVERIVRRHGGTIRAEARAEGGARFLIELPPAPGTEDDSVSV